MPVALGGVFWFGLVALIAVFARPDRPVGVAGRVTMCSRCRSSGWRPCFYLGYASFFVLKTGCVLCIGTYVSVIGIFVVSGSPRRCR